jgi:hypothetical protein
MVTAVRQGIPQRVVARTFRVSLSTVQDWIQRAAGQRLDRVAWQNRASLPRRTRRTPAALEDRVLTVRHALKERSVLGEYGAVAIRHELLARRVAAVPSLRTIGRILVRRGALDGRPRVRRPAPPPGGYLPEVAREEAALERFDLVEGLVIKGGPQVEVLTRSSLHGGLVGAWPTAGLTATLVRELLRGPWREGGLPRYAPFDNDTRFQGSPRYPEALGRVSRLCLRRGMIPVFVPPREFGFQAAIESFNGRWQAKVWARVSPASLAALQARSAPYIAASRARAALRTEIAPPRRPFPPRGQCDPQAPLRGQLIFLRRTHARGRITLLGHSFAVDPLWPHRLVRCEVDLEAARIRFYALRRRAPAWQPLLNEVPYSLPPRRTIR